MVIAPDVDVFGLTEPVASFVPGVADAEADTSGVGEGLTVWVVTCGETGGWTLLRSQIRYPAITTSTKIMTIIVTFLLIETHLPGRYLDITTSVK